MLKKEKIVQSFITGLKEVVDLVKQADVLAQGYKTKWLIINPDLTGTNLSASDVTAINTFIGDLNNLGTGGVASKIDSKYIPSHDTKGVD